MAPNSSGYDFFVSYRRDYAKIVRHIVDILIQNEVSVWFDEWRVLPEEGNQFEDQIADQIADGISASRGAILFTNSKWLESKYCGKEMEQISAQIPAHRILHIALPKDDSVFETYPDLLNSPFHDGGADLPSILEFLSLHSGKSLSHEPVNSAVGDSRVPLLIRKFGLTLDLQGFSRMHLHHHDDRKESTGGFYSKSEGGQERNMFLYVYPYSSTKFDAIPLDADRPPDEDRMMLWLKSFAIRWSRKTGYTIRGSHLIFLDERPHAAFTYFYDSAKKGFDTWERRYILTCKNRLDRTPAEIHLGFSMRLAKSNSYSDNFRAFCRYAAEFDNVAYSFRYSPEHSLTRTHAHRLVLTKAILALAAIGLNFVSENTGLRFLTIALLTDFLMTLVGPTYARMQSQFIAGETSYTSFRQAFSGALHFLEFIHGWLGDLFNLSLQTFRILFWGAVVTLPIHALVFYMEWNSNFQFLDKRAWLWAILPVITVIGGVYRFKSEVRRVVSNY